LFPLLVPIVLIDKRRLKKFFVEWSPFYVILFLYDHFRAIADEIGGRVNYMLLPRVEMTIFGSLPSRQLQLMLGTEPKVLSLVLTGFYFGHFILPVVVLYCLWRRGKQEAFYVSMVSFCVLSLMSFVVFSAFPAAPPWMASITGVIPEVKRLLFENINYIYKSNDIVDIYQSFTSNQFAPFPSIHAAYPTVLFLISLFYIKQLKFIFLMNMIFVSFTLVYFGEHYIIDVIAGMLFSIASFFVSKKLILHSKLVE
jgi:membrane-associated phospholipid phosphatase